LHLLSACLQLGNQGIVDKSLACKTYDK
jgi:hypothetical protein